MEKSHPSLPPDWIEHQAFLAANPETTKVSWTASAICARWIERFAEQACKLRLLVGR